MNPDGDVRRYTQEEIEAMNEEAREALVPVNEKELIDVSRMNRHDRRAWYAQKRREGRRLQKSANTNNEDPK